MILDIIIPIYNKEKQITNHYNKINDELKNIKHNFIFIDDGSTDKSLQILEGLYSNDESNIKIISFSKQFGKDNAICAGLKYSTHELVCIYDIDLQVNTSHILKMYDFLCENNDYDQVCMYSNYELKGLNRLKLNYYNKIYKTCFDVNKTYYRMFRKNVVKGLINYINDKYFTIYSFDELGFNTYYLKFENKNYNNNFNLNNLKYYSICPFKIISIISLVLCFFTLLLLILSILKIITVNNNYLTILLLLLTILIINIFKCNFTHLKNIYNKNFYIIKKTIGFDENIL